MRQMTNRAHLRARTLHALQPIRIGSKAQIAFAATGLCVHNLSRL
jgi:hypothetical protein